MRSRLQKLCDRIAAEAGAFGYRVFADSAPVMEVELAARAGIGWRGKHTLLLDREGSWFFLGEIYCDLPLASGCAGSRSLRHLRALHRHLPDAGDRAPYQLDARRCISYLTIEHKSAIPEELRPLIGNRVYGCDDCQLVCPWNGFATLSARRRFPGAQRPGPRQPGRAVRLDRGRVRRAPAAARRSGASATSAGCATSRSDWAMRRRRLKLILSLKTKNRPFLRPGARARALGTEAAWRWQPDRLLPGFEALELPAPDDYDGRVVATLVRLPARREAPRGAVLYVHGFIDYFFQRHMAERFAAEGYAFYALDLRKHGRSLLPHQHPCFCKDIAEYYDDITRALEEIGADVLLAGHSTGGLICSLVRARRRLTRSRARAVAEQPVLRLARRRARRKLRIAQMLGWFFAVHERSQGRAAGLRAQPAQELGRRVGLRSRAQAAASDSRPTSAGCGRSSTRTPKCTRDSRSTVPVLSMHSDEADIVLDWKQVARWSRTLGSNVTVLPFPGGLHDLVLSRAEIREEVFSQLFAWAA